MPEIYIEENGYYSIDCTAAVWSTNCIHDYYQDAGHKYGEIGFLKDTDFVIESDKAKNDERIIFTGFVQGSLLDELYSNAYIYTLPSDLEGMPLSLLEAMSYGNCCLVSDIPECTEVVEDKALIFKKSDVSDLWEKLQDACNHPENVMELKKEAADFICKKYDWDDVVEKTRELYRRNKSVNIDDRLTTKKYIV